MSRPPRRPLALVFVLALLTVSGCGRAAYEHPQVVEGPPASVQAGPASVGAPVDCPEAGRVAPLPSAEEVTGVLRCLRSTEHDPADGQWAVILEQRVPVTSATDLLSALALPSEHRSDGACAAIGVLPTTVELETTSGPVTVDPPQDSCQLPRREVLRAYWALPWETTRTTRTERLRSEAALAAGCEAWKDMITIDGARARPGVAGPLVDGAAPVSVCLFRSTGPDGEPTGGRQLTGDEAQRLAMLLAAAGPAAACAATHTSFAVIGTSTPVYVELDGCLRILAPDNTIRQGGVELTSLLRAH